MTDRPSAWRDLALPLGLLVLLVALLGPWSLPVRGDRSYYLHHAVAIARGETPYRDFFDVHPPLGWLLAAVPLDLTGLAEGGAGAALLFRGLTLLLAAAMTAATVSLGRDLTGARVGGILAGLLLMIATPHLAREAAEGELKLLVTAALAGSLALAATGRSFAAGLAAGAGFMSYYPGIMAAVAVLALPRGSGREGRGPIRFAFGFALPVAGTMAWLWRRGALLPWYQATLGWIPEYATGTAGNLGKRVDPLAALAAGRHGSGAVLAAIAAASLLAFLVRAAVGARGRRLVSNPLATPLVVVTILLLAYSLLEHGPSDRVLVTPLMAVWASWGLVSLARLPGWSSRLRRLPELACVATAGVALVSVLGHSHPGRVDASLSMQASTARTLAAALPPGVAVSFLGELWPAALAAIPLGSRYFHLGPKMNRAAGEERGGVLRAMLRDKPDLILVARPRGKPLERLERALAGTRYRYAGTGNGFRVWRRKGAVARSASMSALNVLGPPTAGEVARGRGRVAP